MGRALVLIVALAVAGREAVADRIANPEFSTLTDAGAIADWRWWSREPDAGRIEVAEGREAGSRAMRVVHQGKRDWAVSNSRRTPVRPGESYRISCWIRRVGDRRAGSLQVVGLSGGKLVSWTIGRTRDRFGDGWLELVSHFMVPEGVDEIYARVVGSGQTDFLIAEARLEASVWTAPAPGPKVEGWATERPVEAMGRGLVAMETAAGVLVSWRLLAEDPDGIAFDVFRVSEGARVKLNAEAARQTTDFLDAGARADGAQYAVEPARGFSGQAQTVQATPLDGRVTPYIRIPLAAPDATAQKVGIGDLDGDGVYDYVIKQPGGNVDPWHKYWHRSPETFKIEARKQDGTLLWIRDLGWNIERGMWYSPMVVCDLNGNGRAEVALKIGPDEDMRDADGRVQRGPEWVAVLDGLTGQEIARAPWPSREVFEDYNLASRNQIAVAYLDGRTPALLTLRGTYGVKLVDAWQLRRGRLEKLWTFNNEDLPANAWGQGAHNCIVADVDGDGRDEVILGSLALDDNGSVLWTTGKGHPDAHYLGDIDPRRPGWEMAYIIEPPQNTGGIHMLDPATGAILWELDKPTRHAHGSGMCTDMDVMHPGLEIYGADADGHTLTENRWLFASDGRLLKSGKEVDFRFGQPSAWWDADLQREIIRRQMLDYEGAPVSERIEGSVVLVADALGDWREEVITTLPGELRIYTTPIPAMDRRVCLMQDRLYRMRTMMNAMGYFQVPLLSYVPEALAPNLNLTLIKAESPGVCRVVAVAPLDGGRAGRITLTPPKGTALSRTVIEVDLAAGERLVEEVTFTGVEERGAEILAEWALPDGVLLRGRAPLDL